MMKFDDLFQQYLHPLSPVPCSVEPRGRPSRPVCAVLFDVYGTLLISDSNYIRSTDFREAKKERVQKLLYDHGINIDAKQVIDSLDNAIEQDHAEKSANGIDFPEVRIDTIWSRILEIDDRRLCRRLALGFELTLNPVWPMPYLEEMLTAFKKSGLKLGIISNAQFYTALTFQYCCGSPPRKLGFDPDLLLYSFVMGSAKPSSLMFETAAERLKKTGISPASALYVGNDMRNDIVPARKAGFQTALFAGDKRSLQLRKDDPCCRDAAPDMIVTGLDMLAELLLT